MTTSIPTRIFIACAFAWVALSSVLVASSSAQDRSIHKLYPSDLPTGAVGQLALLKKGRKQHYFQPVEVTAPEGAGISLVEDGAFGTEYKSQATVGMLVGQVYQLKVTNIPLNDGTELFPTIEVIDRLCPPEGEELRFPIPIELTLEELNHAAEGKYVTRVIYLEDPRTALGVRQDPREQRYYEIDSSLDPLEAADRIGRPMAILRIGSRVLSDSDVAEGRVRQAPFVKYGKVAPKKTDDKAVATSKRSPIEKSERVPRTDEGQRWSYRPTVLVPQESLPPVRNMWR